VHLHGIRILDALRRLATTDSNIKEVAFDVGYERVSELYRHFGPFTGMTPQEFGRACRAMPLHLKQRVNVSRAHADGVTRSRARY
jgi:AraC-like DNA-binding protein